MSVWYEIVQKIVSETDECIKRCDDEDVTLSYLSERLGFSEYYISHKFSEISGMKFRDYLRHRKLAFALRDVKETDRNLLDIALDYGFSSHEAFSRSFKEAYGITPSEYRSSPFPVVLHTVIKPFDCYLTVGNKADSSDIKTYFIKIPAHKYMHIRNYESIGYWDFWQKQSLIKGQDCETVCGILNGVKDKLDDEGGKENNSGSGQIMAFINEPTGRICSWGIPLAESYGVRLPADYSGEIPEPMLIMDVPEGEYIVFEHGPFDYEKENSQVEAKIENAMKNFDYSSFGYELDLIQGRVFYFYHDCERFWKYIRPVRRIER